MVGLSIVLEKSSSSSSSTGSCGITTSTVINSKIPQVINKFNMIITKPSSSNPCFSPSFTTNLQPSPSFLPFLDHCFLCGQRLLPGKDIYMYKGDRGFCSVECRSRQIFMDEEDCLRKENCSFAAIKPTSNSATSSYNSNSSSNSRRQRKTTRNRAGGFVTY